MTQYEISTLNLGQSLDNLANLDPRGYGVCNILYSYSHQSMGESLCMNAAKKIMTSVKQNDVVFILTGFVLHPFEKAETDGIIGSILIARTLYRAFKIKPVIVCPKEAVKAVNALTKMIKLNPQTDEDKFLSSDKSLLVIEFTKDIKLATKQSETIIQKLNPNAVISVECSGANALGVYHNAVGLDVTRLQAKEDVLFDILKRKGVFNLSIGDLGNEVGMGALKSVEEVVPYLKKGGCRCGCDGGIKANTSADNVITATISDWGAYAFISALAYVCRDKSLLFSVSFYKKLVKKSVKKGLIDMYGEHIPKIDGIGLKIHALILDLMGELVKSTFSHEEKTKTWFEKVDKLNFFNK